VHGIAVNPWLQKKKITKNEPVETTNKMQLCDRVYYSKIY